MNAKIVKWLKRLFRYYVYASLVFFTVLVGCLLNKYIAITVYMSAEETDKFINSLTKCD